MSKTDFVERWLNFNKLMECYYSEIKENQDLLLQCMLISSSMQRFYMQPLFVNDYDP